MALQDLLGAIQSTQEAKTKTVKTAPSTIIETSRTVKTPYETRTFKSPQADKMDIANKVAEEKAIESASPLYKKLGAEERQSILDIQAIPTLVNRLKQYAEVLPEDRAQAMATYAQMNTPGIKTATLTPEQRRFKTATEILVQTVTRLYQKGTLSDTDRKVFSEALNGAAEGRTNYLSGLDTASDLTLDKANNMARTYSVLFDIPENKLKSLMNIDAFTRQTKPQTGKTQYSKTATNPKTGQKMGQLSDGSWELIK